MQTMSTETFIGNMRGPVVRRMDADYDAVRSLYTAWNTRNATWSMVIAGIDPNPQKAGEITRWTKGYWEAVHSYSADGGYVNFMMDDGDDSRLKATYGDNYDRLVALKGKYDPTNFFRVNQNIRPLHSLAITPLHGSSVPKGLS
jgi:hypothetical protein